MCMENRMLENVQNIAMLVLPLLIFTLIKRGEGFKVDMNSSENYQDKARMLQELRPYFLEEDQHILGKVQDIFEILNRVSRITRSDYDDNFKALKQDISMLDRKEKILTELANYMNDSNKQIAEGIVKTKNNLLKAKENLEGYSQAVSTQNLDRLTSMVKFANSIEPLMPDKGKVQIKKLERIANIMKASDDHFKPLY